MLNGLDLFSGIGGITIALSEWVKPIAYCEIDQYPRAVLLSRMSDGELPKAPIWDDVQTLKGSFLPAIDIIYGGFPCQDISIAGSGAGLEGKRSGLFFEIMRLVDEIQPTFIFLENVPAITTRGLGTTTAEITKRGYDCRWTTLSAAEVGAPHKRNRWWLLALSDSDSKRGWQKQVSELGGKDSAKSGDDGEKEPLAYSGCFFKGCERKPKRTSKNLTGCCGQWTTEPDVGRVVNGLPFRVDRIKALGNSVVPIQAKEAFKELMGIKKI